MFEMKTGVTKKQVATEAVQELVTAIRHPAAKLVVFFADFAYDFAAIAAEMAKSFPGVVTIGCTTAGEIAPGLGYTAGTVVATSFSSDDFHVEPVLIEDAKRNVLLAKSRIVEAAQKVGLKAGNGFGVLFEDWVPCVDEKLVMMLNTALPNVPVIGGTAADGGQFQHSAKIACNGKTYEGAALVTLVRTSVKVFPYRENIFVASDVELSIDAANVNTREVYKINGKPAEDVYAELMHCKVSDLNFGNMLHYPVGRIVGNEVFCVTPSHVLPGGGMRFHSSLLPGSKVRLLKAIDPVEAARHTAEEIKRSVPNCKGILGFSCLVRRVMFDSAQNAEAVYKEIAKVAPFAGMTVYGEQYKHHVNQTLVLLAFGE